MLDISIVKGLLHEDESTTLDFKRDQYAFDGADNNTKGELLKDILAFTNAWRRTSAYILIGVEENAGGRNKVVGISKKLDDAKLQQFVNSKTHKPIEFSYQTLEVDSAMVGVIEIPVQKRPIYLIRGFGKLEKEKVYIRRGSSTDIATPDEISEMGASSITKEAPPHLELEWADLDSHKGLSTLCTVQTLFLHPWVSHESRKSYKSSNLTFPELYGANEDYPQEIIEFTFETNCLQILGLRLSNQSGVVAKRVGFVGSIAKESGILVRDWSERPRRPRKRFTDVLDGIVPIAEQLRDNPNLSVQKYEAYWEVSIEFGDVRPQDEVWAATPILIGAADSREIKLEGELRGDNLPRPITCTLNVNLEVEKRPMENADIQQYMG